MYARDFRQGQSWLTGTIMRGLGPVSFEVKTSDDELSFEVKTSDDQLICRTQDHTRKRSS